MNNERFNPQPLMDIPPAHCIPSRQRVLVMGPWRKSLHGFPAGIGRTGRLWGAWACRIAGDFAPGFS